MIADGSNWPLRVNLAAAGFSRRGPASYLMPLLYLADAPLPHAKALVEQVRSTQTAVARYLDRVLEQEETTQAWNRAIRGLKLLSMSGRVGTAKHLSALRELAADPILLEACRAGVLGAEILRDMVGVLMVATDDASREALAQCASDASIADVLLELQPLASSDAQLAELLARARTTVVKRRLESPALALAKWIGLAVQETFWFALFVMRAEGLARVRVEIDSRKTPWFDMLVDLAPNGGVRVVDGIIHQDQIRLPSYDAHMIPQVIAEGRRRSGGAPWTIVEFKTNLRGHQRDALMKWLLPDHDATETP